MIGHDTGINMLFGVIALQLDLIDASQFAEACTAWAGRKEMSLGDLLEERGWVGPEDRAEIDRVLRRKLDRRGGDARLSLVDAMDHSVGTLVASAVLEEDEDLGMMIGGETDEAVPPRADDAPTVDKPGETRDRFRLVRMYAQGGLGQVWLARDPVLGRDVALKELRPEKASDPMSRARFLREARITGRLEHPGIVTVHEMASREDDGRAFYAMQLVRGRTLREAVGDYHAARGGGPDRQLELHALLDDFVAVCNAVAYAHSRGVIHRDLKGQNIVLGDFGEVVVLDWGLAKVVGRPESAVASGRAEETLDSGERLTLDGQRMGTPGFMAPEQAEGRHEQVGVGSDIYGLGAILYEILTGLPPFGDSGVTEALRRVSEEDPVPPRRACPDVPAALEAVCLKALSKRPEDRYHAAADLAQDVRRWLADEPVSAYREPAAERLGRWCRRHRTAMIAGAAFLTMVVAGLAVLVFATKREQAKTRAALASEARHRRQAEAHFALARDAVDNLYEKILDSPLLSEPGMGPLRLALISTTQGYYAKLVSWVPEDPDLKVHLGGSYLTLSRVTLRAGEVDRAIEQLGRALAIFEALAAGDPGRASYRNEIAHCHLELAESYRDASRPDAAAAAYERAIDLWRRLDEETKRPRYAQSLATAYNCLGSLARSVGHWDQAETAHTRALAVLRRLADESPPALDRERIRDRMASCLSGLAGVSLARRDWEAAEARYREAHSIWADLQAAHPNQSYRSEMAALLGGWSKVRAGLGRAGEARSMRERALGEWSALAREYPEVVLYRDQVANEHVRVGEYLEAEGLTAGAGTHYEAALEAWKKLAPRYPGRPDLKYNQARALYHLGGLRSATSGPSEAARYYREARSLWEGLSGRLREDYEREYRPQLISRAPAEDRSSP